MKEQYDVIVIGAGPAGYVAAIRCAQLGFKTACIDRWINKNKKPAPGGTCLNAGCIPSKALLESSSIYEHARLHVKSHGVQANDVQLDLKTMMSRKDKIVSELTMGISGLFKANKIDWLQGSGKLLSNKQVEFTEHGKKKPKITSAENIILATGSSSVEFSAAPLENNTIVDSSGALEFTSVPERLGIIGAGVIGLELGSVWRCLGSEVILLEAQDCFLNMADEQISKGALREFTRQGLDIRLGARVLSSDVSTKGKTSKVIVNYQQDNQSSSITVDKLIVAIGRKPNTENLFTKEIDLNLDNMGAVHVDDQCRTTIPGVYAIGDMVRGPMLAHKGSEEGIMVAELIAGQHAEVNYDTIPSVIYTHPEVAWAGKTEQALKTSGIEYRSGTFPFLASGRAKASGETTGMVKVLADATTDRVLGVHMIGQNCSELIGQAVIAMELGASSEDIALTMFAHPTLSEAFHEAALAVDKRAIHLPPPRKR